MVEIHQLAKDFYRLRTGILKDWRLISLSRGRQGFLPCKCSAFDEIYLCDNPIKL
jgi:hypothetical protein